MCVKVVDEMNGKLIEEYVKWYGELSNSNKSSQLLDKDYSNPYYIGVPDDWEKATYKIMIVGKEGYGKWGCGKNDPKINPCTDEGIKEIQAWNLKYLSRQLAEKDSPPVGNSEHWNNSRFWQRIRGIRDICEAKISFIWNNMDKIHRIPKNKGESCVLGKKKRRMLHDAQILKTEIEITQPNVVIFFGNYWDKSDGALCKELTNVSNKLNTDWKNDYKDRWKDKHIIAFKCNDIYYIFTYHPGCSRPPKGYAKKQDYEEAVVDAVKRALEIEVKP